MMTPDIYRQIIEALRPFGDACVVHEEAYASPRINDDIIVMTLGLTPHAKHLQMGDFRRARDVVTKLEHGK